MSTISSDERYTRLLKATEFGDWHMFVIGACYAIESFTGDDMKSDCLGLVEANRRGVDWNAEHWKFYLWQLGAHADFVERLQRATTERPDGGADCGDDGADPQQVDGGGMA